MAGRYKRATAPLDSTARARLWWEGSGVESAESCSDSAELADLVDSFYREEEIENFGEVDDMGSTARGERRASLEAVLAESEADSVARRIRVETERAVRAVGQPGGDGFRRRVTSWLRDKGFDAGLCKSSWERSDGIAGGDHEYVDVIDRGGGGGGARYILEINFAAEFEIARPTEDYAALLRALPPVFVGRPGTLERVVRLMCAAMEESIRRSGMHLPPWRRREYVQAKWFSSYETEREMGGSDTHTAPAASASRSSKLCRIQLRCREMEVRTGMLAVELKGASKGYGF